MIQDDLDTTVVKRPRADRGRLSKIHASLIVLNGAEIGRDFRLRKSGLIVGRSVDANIRLPDEQASRAHARVDRSWDAERQHMTYSITDLQSTNRTIVNSKPIKRVELKDGDKIQIGDTVLKFVVLDHIEAAFHTEIRNLITYDQLTGLLTKESLFLALESELQRCLRYEYPLAVLMMDLDHFKSVNDGYGHLMGSHVLAVVGRLIRDSMRDDDVSGRYGGEEFISYLAEDGVEAAQLAAERIRVAIETDPFTLDGVTIDVRISIGLATAPDHGRDVNTLVKAADEALYRAKESGRNRVCTAGE